MKTDALSDERWAPKLMSIKEFREKGFLQEVNRLFFHPLGLAIEILVREDGTEVLGGIWDYRDDPEGMIFDVFLPEALAKAAHVRELRLSKQDARGDLLGWKRTEVHSVEVQSIP